MEASANFMSIGETLPEAKQRLTLLVKHAGELRDMYLSLDRQAENTKRKYLDAIESILYIEARIYAESEETI